MHIDYANRPESALEAEYLRRWCARRHVALRVRVVHEVSYVSLGLTSDLLWTHSGDTWADSARRVRDNYRLTVGLLWTQVTRGLTPRDEYEKVSREIRSTTTRGDQVDNNKYTSNLLKLQVRRVQGRDARVRRERGDLRPPARRFTRECHLECNEGRALPLQDPTTPAPSPVYPHPTSSEIYTRMSSRM